MRSVNNSGNRRNAKRGRFAKRTVKAVAKPLSENYVESTAPVVNGEYIAFSTLKHGADILGTVVDTTSSVQAEVMFTKDRSRRVVDLTGLSPAELPAVGDVLLDGTIVKDASGSWKHWESVTAIWAGMTVEIDTDRGDRCTLVLRQHPTVADEMIVVSKSFHH